MRWIFLALAVALIGCDPDVAETPTPSPIATLTPSPVPQTVVVDGVNWNEPVVWDYEPDRATIFGSQVPDTLVVECSGGALEAHIAIGDGLRPLPGAGQDTQEIEWSVNDGQPLRELWGRSEDGMTLYVPDRAVLEILRVEEEPLIFKIRTAVRIDAVASNETTRPLEFELPALDSGSLSCVP